VTGYRVRNWLNFQHYRDRNPPWIKLHFALLSSRDWVQLDDASRVLAIACMLIASRNDGVVPDDSEYLKRVAYLNSVPDFKPLIDCGFLECASKMLASASTSASTSVSVSIVNKELKRKKNKRAELQSLPADWTPSEATVKRLAIEFRLHIPEDVERYLSAFRDACQAKDYHYKNFDAAFSNCVRQDWPKFRHGKATMPEAAQESPLYSRKGPM
jgi:hypothetical protein